MLVSDVVYSGNRFTGFDEAFVRSMAFNGVSGSGGVDVFFIFLMTLT